ncbi:MAG: hypothetical protein JJU29_02780 [Verrucomicrobia bacterium]|nr:hypothetical protein [Verrucomicrobiota bacterium]MCH8511419.1 hypothetical protein [Kiritimatiellia bacterium]
MKSNTSKIIFSFSFSKTLVLLLTSLIGTLVIASLVTAFGFPEPYIHDEFAYLLGADTFLQGRLTNPTPPFSEFFETFHVNMEPTYHSKYPPGQSVFLALGKLLSGMEIYGVWLSFILAAVAVAWALLAVFPPRWAFLGGLLAIANSTLLLKWAFSFWGGSVAMLGGALLMGGLLRLYQNPRVSGALWMSLGLVILAFSRPLEGLITAGIVLLFYLATLVKSGQDFSGIRKNYKVLGVIFLTGILILAMNLFYNKMLTGAALTFPHGNWNASESSHEMIRAYQGSQLTTVWFRLQRFFTVFMGPFLWLPTLLVFRRIRDPRILAAAFAVLIVSVYSVMTSRAWPHYIAPIAPFVIGLQVAGCKILFQWKIGNTRTGLILMSLLLTLHYGREIHAVLTQGRTIHFEAFREQGAVFKRDLDRFLEEKPGKHIILVRYLEGHSLHREYVYNRADIPSAKVIWAREMSQEENRGLFEAYPDRQIWLLQLRNFPVEMSVLEESER